MRTIKPYRNLLLVVCPTLVLVFLFYASRRLNLLFWSTKLHVKVDTSPSEGRFIFPGRVYDKQGFLLKPDGKLPLEIQYKYGNLSKGECKQGFAGHKMTSIYPKFRQRAPMFLSNNLDKFAKLEIHLHPPPFGVKTQEEIISFILSEAQNYGLGEELDSLSCKRCIIIGNSGNLVNTSLGSKINMYDVVIRLNGGLIRGYEKDVGHKTTMRITYPEGAFQNHLEYEESSLFVLSAFKPLDFQWLRHMVFKEKMKFPLPVHIAKRGTEGFWKPVARRIPRGAEDIRILNPYFIQEASFQFIGLPFNNGKMGPGNIPTLGTVAITMALHNCDEVAVAGFGYNMSNPSAPLHYYEKQRMSAIKESWTHNIDKEKEFLRKLKKARVIRDLTNGI